MVWPRGEALTYSDVSAWIAGDDRAAWLGGVPARVRSQATRIARRALVDSIRIAARRPQRFRSRFGGSEGFARQAGSAAELRQISGRWHEVRPPACRGTVSVWCRVRVDTCRQPPSAPFQSGKVMRVTRDAADTWWLTLTGPTSGKAAAPAANCGVRVGVVHTLTVADDAGKVLHLDLPALLNAGEAARLRSRERAHSRARDSIIPCRLRPCPHDPGGCWKQSARCAQRRRQIAELQRAQRRRRDRIERVTTRLADRYELVAVEDLHIRAMTASAAGSAEAPGRNVASKRALNRAIIEAAGASSCAASTRS